MSGPFFITKKRLPQKRDGMLGWIRQISYRYFKYHLLQLHVVLDGTVFFMQ